MRVGWLHDDPGYLGGAELTMAEFKAAAPEGVEVVDCRPGEVVEDLDRYVIGNCGAYSNTDLPALGYGAPVVRYHHDVQPRFLNQFLTVARVKHVFCSPLQRERMGMEGECIPPALDLKRFFAAKNNGRRDGAVCVGRMAYGKGLELLAEYEEPVDVYSTVPFPSEGNAFYRGETEDVPKTLAAYDTFVFLPTALEPFGRAVVEAWAAGLTLVVNKNVGAMHYILNAQEKLHSAGEDFWRLVLRG